MGATLVNDVHSRLNPTAVADVVPVDSLAAIRRALARAREGGRPVAVAGGRHAMGGQQFCAGGLLLDTRPLRRVLAFDPRVGTVEVEAGVQWPELIRYLEEVQQGDASPWAIAQKQTGANSLSIGGAVAANVHGRGLSMRPFVADVEALVVVDAEGAVHRCDRSENEALFRLVAGGYGLFGVVYSATLRLVPRRVVERVVELETVERLVSAFERRIAEGFLYGDFQFAIDPASPGFLRRGVFSCYRPLSSDTPIPSGQRRLSRDHWRRLLHLAHTEKSRAFEAYAAYYLSTSGQRYRSDTHQLAEYIDDYHLELDAALGVRAPRSEMITEIFVPRARLVDFMAAVADDFRAHDVDLIYGTVRLVERDDESFLAWAREPWACVIFNLCVEHSRPGVERAAAAFRRLIDRAIARGGSYYLTYHRFATREQVTACYPRFEDFLRAKLEHDAGEVFQSEWYRHYARAFSSPPRAVAA